MNEFTLVLTPDETSALELQLGRFIPTAAGQVALLTAPQSANVMLAGPASGPNAAPAYRQIVTADLVGITLPVANGGTGAIDAPTARSNLGAAKVGANSDITSLSGLTTALSVSQGGTGSTSGSGVALDNVSGFAANGYVKRTGAGAYSQVGTVPVSDGGTGGTTQASARSGIGAAASGANSDITSLSGLTTALSIAQGGTNAATAAAARSNLGAAASGANSDITSLSGLTTALSIAQGGTGQTSQAAALAALLASSLIPIANGGTNSSSAASALSNLGGATKPQAAAGVGQFQLQIATLAAALVLPAGGSWAYFALPFNASGQVSTSTPAPVAGVAAGGTTVGAATSGWFWYGFSWRVS